MTEWTISKTTRTCDRLSYYDQQLLWRVVATMLDACGVPRGSVSVSDVGFTQLLYGRVKDFLNSEETETTYYVDDIIEAKSTKRGVATWYGATVAEVRPNGSYLVDWEDGDMRAREKRPEEIREKKEPAAVAARNLRSI